MAPRPRRLLLTTSRLPTDSLVIDSVEWDRLRGARALVRLTGTAGAKLPAGRVRLSLDSRARSYRFESLPPLGGHTQGPGPWSAAFELPRKLLPLLERGASVQIGRLVVAVPGSDGRSGRGSARADEYAPVDVPPVPASSAGAPDPASSVPAGDRAVEAEPDFVPATPVPDPLMTRSAAEAAPPSGETGGDVEDAQLALTSVTDLLAGLRQRLDSARAEIGLLNEEVDRLPDELGRSYAHLGALRAERDGLGQLVARSGGELAARLAELELALGQLRRETERLTGQLAVEQSARATVERELSAERSQLASVRQREATAAHAAAALQRQLDELGRRSEQLYGAFAEADRRVEQAVEVAEASRRREKELGAELARARAETGERQREEAARVRELSVALERERSSARVFERELGTAHHDLASERAIVDESAGAAVDLRSELTARTRELDEQSRGFEDSQQRLDELSVQLDAARSEADDLRKREVDSERIVGEIVDRAGGALNHAEHQTAESRQAVVATQAQAGALERELADERSRFGRQTSDVEERLAGVSDQLASVAGELLEQLESEQQARAAAETERDDAHRGQRRAIAVLAERATESDRAGAGYARMQQAMVELPEQVEGVRDQTEDGERRHAAADQSIARLPPDEGDPVKPPAEAEAWADAVPEPLRAPAPSDVGMLVRLKHEREELERKLAPFEEAHKPRITVAVPAPVPPPPPPPRAGAVRRAAADLDGDARPLAAWLPQALPALAAADPDAAGRLILDLLPVHSLLADESFDYDLELTELGSYRVSVRPEHTTIRPLATGDGLKPPDFAIHGDAAALAELMVGSTVRRSRWNGRLRIVGQHRKARSLQAIGRADMTLGHLSEAGLTPDPLLVARALSYAGAAR